MSRGLSVFVSIGAKLLPSLNASAMGVERRMGLMTKRIRLHAAETKAALAGMEEAQNKRWAVIGRGAAAAFVGAQAIKPFVAFEDRLVRLGNTAEVHGARLDIAGQEIIRVGARFGTGASAAAEGVNDFVAAGLSLDSSIKALAPTLKLAKTSGIEITEASQAGISVMQNLGVEAGRVGRSFDIMAKAGKLGRFELNDMAKAFPGLASRAKLLGMSGTDGVARLAAMLQPIREGARDADEAANNLLNLFDKLTGKETSDYFSKMGVNIPAVFAKAKREGRDFVTAMLDETARLTKGGTDAFALSKLFPDRQARQAMLLLLQNRGKVDSIRRQSLNSRGTLDADFGRIRKTSKFGLDRTVAGLERIGIALGKAFGPALGDMAERFAVFAERFAGWAEKHPSVVKTIGSLVVGMIALRTAGAAVGLMFGGLFGKLARFGAGKLAGGIWSFLFSSVGKAGPRIPFIRIIGSILGGLGRSLLSGLVRMGPLIIRGLIMAFGLLSNPVGWGIILAGVAAALIWYFRDDLARAWPKVVAWFKNAWTGLKNWLGSIDWSGIGMRIADALTFGLASKFGAAMASIKSKMPSGTGMNSTRGGLAGARARGGPVRRGGLYLVGEEGPELFRAPQSGRIVPTGRTAAMLAAMAMVPAAAAASPVTSTVSAPAARAPMEVTININGGQDPRAIALEVRRELNRLANGQAALLSD